MWYEMHSGTVKEQQIVWNECRVVDKSKDMACMSIMILIMQKYE